VFLLVGHNFPVIVLFALRRSLLMCICCLLPQIPPGLCFCRYIFWGPIVADHPMVHLEECYLGRIVLLPLPTFARESWQIGQACLEAIWPHQFS
jgi:hypothetical protein